MSRRRIAGAALLAALLLMAGVAYASIPEPDGVIHGCYKNSNPAQGAMIVVDHTASCPSGYTTLNWNQTGPQGPAGANGVSGYVVLNTNQAWASDAYDNSADINCPSGKVAIAGGGLAGGGTGNAGIESTATLSRSVPLFDGQNYVGWGVSAHRSFLTAQPSVTTVYVVCAAIGS